MRRPNFFQFQANGSGVFLRCVSTQCLTVEGASRDIFEKINSALGWMPAPGSTTPPASNESIAQLVPLPQLHGASLAPAP